MQIIQSREKEIRGREPPFQKVNLAARVHFNPRLPFFILPDFNYCLRFSWFSEEEINERDETCDYVLICPFRLKVNVNGGALSSRRGLK